MEPPVLTSAEKKYLRRVRAYWQKLICSTRPLNPTATEKAIAAAYHWLGYAKPKIIFVNGPQAALDQFLPLTQSGWSQMPRRSLMLKLWHLILWPPAFIVSYCTGFLICWFGILLAPTVIGIILVTTMAKPDPILEYTVIFLGILSTIPIALLYAKLNLYSWILAISAIAALLIAGLWLTDQCLQKIDQLTLFLVHRFAGKWLYRDFFETFGDSLDEEFREFWNDDEAHTLIFRTYRLNQTFYSPKLTTYVNQLCRINQEYQRQLIPARERLHPYLFTTKLLFLPQEGFWSRGQWVQDVSTLEFELEFSPTHLLPNSRLQTWWQVYRDLAANCHLIIPFRKVCVVCQRPTQIEMNSKGMLHAVARPAWVYADGSAWYFYKGVLLPPNIGTLPPDQWQSDWLLTQPDHWVRQVLISEIGYERICQELPTWLIDAWRDYTLLSIEFKTPTAMNSVVPRVWQDGHILKKAGSGSSRATYWQVPRRMKTVQAALQWLKQHSPTSCPNTPI
jgi:hypothetical protein